MTDKKGASQQQGGNEPQPLELVVERDGQAVADSRIIADVFGKEHSKVLRAIRSLECSDEFAQANFGQGSYINENNREMPMYEMTRDGFSFLVMGFTGKEAAQWKEKYIAAFNLMEDRLRHPSAAPKTYEESLKALADQCNQTILALDAKKKAEAALEEARPVLECAKRLGASDGSVSVTEAAKALKVRPKELFTRLSAEKWIYKRPGAKSWLGYQDKIQSGYLEHRDHVGVRQSDGSEFVSTQVKVTGKGMLKLSEILCKQLHLIGAEE